MQDNLPLRMAQIQADIFMAKSAIDGYTGLITLHTHPSSMPPSINDFNTYHQRKYGISLVICHDGTIITRLIFGR